jgi:predicted AAA+ superfamily ATPase
MKRIVDAYLNAWKEEKYRKPLLLKGARQVGKTHAVRQLGKTFASFVEINFEKEPRAAAIFAPDKSLAPRRMLEELVSLSHAPIHPGRTLLFFDEIQAAPRAITALRYFYEELPELHVIAAGSLINFAIEQVGMPVGRLSFLYMYPLSFLEFLSAIGYPAIASLLEKPRAPLSAGVHTHLLELVGKYLAVGGMPEAINRWCATGNIGRCLEVLQGIVSTYRQDFNKYARKVQIQRVENVFNTIPFQLGKKFKYSEIEGEYRKRDLAPAFDLLVTANVAYRIAYTAAHGLPLGAEVDLSSHKALLMDVAVCQKMLNLAAGDWILNPLAEFVNKGALVEAFVGQELLCYADPRQEARLYYWQRQEKNSAAEIDYLIQEENSIIPIEVKSGHGSTLKSMHLFLQSHKKSPYGIRFSQQPFSVHNKIHSYPLYAIAPLVVKNSEMVRKGLGAGFDND